jgi:hypothetical protein
MKDQAEISHYEEQDGRDSQDEPDEKIGVGDREGERRDGRMRQREDR